MNLADPAVSVFLARPIVARIASVNPNSLQPQVDAVWYYWDGKHLWLTCAYGSQPPNPLHCVDQCAVIIEEKSEAGKPQGILLEGEISPANTIPVSIEIKRKIAARYANAADQDLAQVQDWIQNSGVILYRLIPLETHTW